MFRGQTCTTEAAIEFQEAVKGISSKIPKMLGTTKCDQENTAAFQLPQQLVPPLEMDLDIFPGSVSDRACCCLLGWDLIQLSLLVIITIPTTRPSLVLPTASTTCSCSRKRSDFAFPAFFTRLALRGRLKDLIWLSFNQYTTKTILI